MSTKRYTFKEGLQALVKEDGLQCLYRQGSEKDSYAVKYTFNYEEGLFMESKCARLPNGSVICTPQVPAKFDSQIKEDGFVLNINIPLAKALAFDETVEKLREETKLTVYSNVTREISFTRVLKEFVVETDLYDLTITRNNFNGYRFYDFS